MTQEEFIKKFCPDSMFEDSMFEEALQNFTYKICEAQKEICASGSSVYLNINSRPYPNELIAIIIGSVHPNIENL